MLFPRDNAGKKKNGFLSLSKRREASRLNTAEFPAPHICGEPPKGTMVWAYF